MSQSEVLFRRFKNDGIAELKLNPLQKLMKVEVDKKVKTGIYQFEVVDCAVCGSSSNDVLSEKDRYGLFYNVKICRECGFVFTSPRMNQESYNTFYNVEYRKLYGGLEHANETFFIREVEHGRRIAKLLESHEIFLDRDKLVLEIGCGAGGILEAFRQKGMRVKGFDLGEEYVKYGKDKYGLDIEVGTLADYKLDHKPDLIIYSHVMEHVLDTNSEIEMISAICHENTIVYIEVPGIKSIHLNYEKNLLKYFQNAHTFHFSLNTLSNIFCLHGFKLLYGDEKIRSIFKKESCSQSIKNDYFETLKYLRNQERFRTFYLISPFGILKMLNKRLSNLFKLMRSALGSKKQSKC